MGFEITSSKIQVYLAQTPPESLPPELYAQFSALYSAIQLLQVGISRYAGVDPQDVSARPFLIYQDTLLETNLTRMYPTASVAIARGQIINLFDNAGVLQARLAQANSATTRAHGVANEAAAPGAQFEMYWRRGCIDSIGGMTLGSEYYLSPTVAGAIQTTRPTVVGQIIQHMGLALSANTLQLDISPLHIQL
jgi:hypothetical protein